MADEGIQTIVNARDNAVSHPPPNGVINTLKRGRVAPVLGRRDLAGVQFRRKPNAVGRSIGEHEFTRLQQACERFTSQNLEYLTALPQTWKMPVGGVSIAPRHYSQTLYAKPYRVDDPYEAGLIHVAYALPDDLG